MKKIIFTMVLFVAAPALADEYVNGYYRHDGTYVPPHHQTAPNGNPYDNYSTRGNVNPYTGQAGTIDPYEQQQRRNNSRLYGNPNGALYGGR